MPAERAFIYRDGVLRCTVSAHHKTAIRRAAMAPASIESMAGRSCTIDSLRPVLEHLEQIGTIDRVDDRYQLTDRGLVDMMSGTTWGALTMFEDADHVFESTNASAEPERSPAVMASLAQWGLVTRSPGKAEITPKGRRVMNVVLGPT